MQTVLSSFSANAIPWQVDALHNRVDFQCFGKGLWKKRCQTMSNHVKPESLQCDLRQYIATGGCNHGKPTKIHEPNHTLPANRRLHILQLVGGFNKTEKYASKLDHLAQKFGVANYLGLDLMNLPSIFKGFTFAKGIEICDSICESKRHNRSVFSNPKPQKEFATFREEYRFAMLQSRSPIFTGQV